MKTKITISLLVTASCLFNAKILQAQTWSHGTGELRTGIPLGGLGGASATTGSILFYNSTNTNTVNIQSGTTSPSYTLTLPTSAPAVNGSVLSSTTAGVLSWNAGVANIYEASLSLSATDIQNLFSTPLDVVAAPGAGKYIEVISASFAYTFVTTAYASNTNIALINNGSANQQAGNSSLNSISTRITNFSISQLGGTGTQIIENTSLQIKAPNGNPTTGDGTGKIKVLYRIVTI